MSVIPDLIAQGLPPVDGAPIVTYENAATSLADSNDAERVAYSQMVQRYFLPPEHVPDQSEIVYYWRRRLNPPTLPPAILSYQQLDEMSQDRPSRQLSGSNGTLHRRPTSRPYGAMERYSGPVVVTKPKGKQTRRALVVPDGYAGIHQELATYDAPCAPALLFKVANENRVSTKNWLATNQGPWAPIEDIAVLAAAIKAYEIAPMDTGDPDHDVVPVYRLVVEFSGKQTNLTEGDVQKVALKMSQETGIDRELFTRFFRFRKQDGSAGPLALHYTKKIADMVRARLKVLETGQLLATIRRW